MQITLFYIPFGTESDANAIGREAIVTKLAACANVFPIQSTFPWEGAMQQESEYVLILKTVPSLEEKVRDFISNQHPYEVPCIMCWNVEVNETYGKWILTNVE